MSTRPITRATRVAFVIVSIALAAVVLGPGSPARAGVPRVVMVEDFTATW